MVHEDVDRVVARLGEPRAEPGGARLAETAAMVARLHRIDDQQAPDRGRQGILHEAVPVHRGFGKGGDQGGAVVVIAGHQVIGHREAVEDALEGAVGAGRAFVGQVAGEDAEPRVGVMGVDVGDAGLEACRRVDAVDRRTLLGQMGVGDLQHLHRVVCPRNRARRLTLPRASFG